MKCKFRKTILTVVIFIYFIFNVNAVTIYDTDWTNKEDITLEWGDSYSTGNYTILAEDFDKQAIQSVLTIVKNNEEIHTAITSAGETIAVSTIKITINEIGGCSGDSEIPYVKMTIFTMKPPALSIDLENNMTSDGLMNLTFIVENSGGIRFTNITLNVMIPDDLKVSGNKYDNSFDSLSSLQNGSLITGTLENLSAGSKETIWAKLVIPALPDIIEIPINIDALGYDLDNRPYEISKNVNVIVEPALKVYKDPIHAFINDSNVFYINDRVYVSITVFNSATTDANDISITETLMTSNFVLDPDTSLDWTIDLPARTSESFYYFMRPIRPGDVQISTTNVSREYKGQIYLKTIDPTTVKIYGSYFKISKNLDNNMTTLDETVIVTVVAENTGNHASYLTLTDEIPEYAQFIQGTLNTSEVVKPGDTISLNYTLKIKKIGDYRFPSAIGKYKETHYEGTAYSTRPLIQVSEITLISTIIEPINTENNSNDTIDPENTEQNSIPGFGFLSTLTIINLAYLMRNKRK